MTPKRERIDFEHPFYEAAPGSMPDPEPLDAHWKQLPAGAIGSAATRVLFAVMSEQRPTCGSIAAKTNLSAPAVLAHLRHLARQGLVTWEQRAPDGTGRYGTIRALVEFVR